MNYELIAQWSDVISSLLFIAALVFLWVRYIQPAVLTAQAAQNARIAEAERHRDHAKAALDELRGELDRAHGDAQAIEQRSVAQARAEQNTLLAEARAAGERVVQNAQGELGRAREAAAATLREELLESALRLAREQAAHRVDAEINKRLVHSFSAALGEV